MAKKREPRKLPVGTRIYQHYLAPNDTNGNPRRLWVVYEVGNLASSDLYIAEVIDEGYGGRPEKLNGVPCVPPVDVSTGEYNAMVRFAKASSIFRPS